MSKEDTKFLKGIAIILLLYHHDPFYSDYGFFLQSGARVCVWLFIFISAYGFTLQMKEGYEKKPVRFVIKRILLLYAQMWFFYLFNLTMSIIWDPGLIGYFKSSVFNLPIDMLGLYNLFGKPEIASYWYLNFLIVVIAVFPLLYYLAKWTSWFSIPIVILVTQICPYKMTFVHGGQLNYYLLMVMVGILFAQYNVIDRLKKIRQNKDFLIVTLSTVLISVLLVVRYILLPFIEEKWYLGIGPVSTVIALNIIILVCFYRKEGKINVVMKKLGDHSGNIFYIHWFFYNYLRIVLKINNGILCFLLCMAYCLLISWFVEFVKKKTGYNERVRKGLKLMLRE